jgi:hypothetical protein
MLLVVGAGRAGGVPRIEGVVATVVGFSIAVVGVRNASTTPDITTAATAPTDAIAAGYQAPSGALSSQPRASLMGSPRIARDQGFALLGGG